MLRVRRGSILAPVISAPSNDEAFGGDVMSDENEAKDPLDDNFYLLAASVLVFTIPSLEELGFGPLGYGATRIVSRVFCRTWSRLGFCNCFPVSAVLFFRQLADEVPDYCI